MYEDEKFSQREIAALVASKVYYHLGAFEESVAYALGAGSLFDVNSKSEYVSTIIGNNVLLFLLSLIPMTSCDVKFNQLSLGIVKKSC